MCDTAVGLLPDSMMPEGGVCSTTRSTGDSIVPTPLLERISDVVKEQPDVVAVASFSIAHHDPGEALGGAASLQRSNAWGHANVQLTYRNLWMRACALAERINAAIGLPQPHCTKRTVVTFVEEGWELPVTFLSILIASATFVPLDINDPAERLALAIEDCNADLVIHCAYQTAAVRSKLPDELSVFVAAVPRLAVVGSNCQGGDDCPPKQMEILPTSVGHINKRDTDTVAYIVYTSGSSGAPKGVVVSQASLAAFCSARVGGRVLLITSFAMRSLHWLPAGKRQTG